MDKQTTIKDEFMIVSRTPENKPVTLHCIPYDDGIILDVKGKSQKLDPSIIYIDSIPYTTAFKINGGVFTTPEHVLSALWGMGVDNCIISVDQYSMPFDATSRSFVDQIKAVGVRELNKPRTYINIEKTHIIGNKTESMAILKPANRLIITLEIDYPNIMGNHKATYTWSPGSYDKKICDSRTRVCKPIDGELTSWKEFRKYVKVLPKYPNKLSPYICFTDDRYIVSPRDSFELVAHKILDFIGDSSLLGQRLYAHIYLYRTGHSFNNRLIKFIYNEYGKNKRNVERSV